MCAYHPAYHLAINLISARNAQIKKNPNKGCSSAIEVSVIYVSALLQQPARNGVVNLREASNNSSMTSSKLLKTVQLSVEHFGHLS